MNTNQSIAKLLSEMAVLLAMEDVPFKPRAYEQAAHSIEGLSEDLGDIYKKGGPKALLNVPSVGKGIAEKIEEYLQHGRIKEYESLKKKFPVDVEGLLQIEGIGPKSILKLYKELKIKNVEQLKKAAKAGKLRKIPGLGPKTEDNILRGIGFVQESGGRAVLAFMMSTLEAMVEKLCQVPGVTRAAYAGSARRMQETIGDFDLLVASDDPEKVMEVFIHMPQVVDVLAHGPTKSSARLGAGLDADLRVVPEESFGAALQYFTGDKYHNVKLRQAALDQGYTLNEYGLSEVKGKGKGKIVAGRREEEIYEKLGFAWMPPELRTNTGELEAARNGKLPNLIGYDDLRGDLQVQTDWTDGQHSIEDMAKAAKKLGLEYICITDHTRALAMTGGSDEKKLLRQMKEIDEVQKRVSGFKILKGAEVNILKDGTLDIDDETLAKLDVVGIAVHSHFNLSEEEQTARIIRAMENPNADILFHPTGRIIQKREPYKVDIDAVIAAAKRTKTILEIDAYPTRLDLKDDHIRKALEGGVKFSIDSDAHAMGHFQFLRYGIGQARRGWVTKDDVINTRSWEKMLKLLK